MDTTKLKKEDTMKRLSLITVCIFMIITTALWAGDFAVYPGAKFDEKLTKDAIQMSAGAPGAEMWNVEMYMTKDAFEKVCAFYAKIGKEYNMPSSPKEMKLPSGSILRTQYYLFGGAADLQSAKSWIKVQNPLISHKKVQILGPGTKSQDTGEIPGVTTIMHMKRK